MILEEKDSDFFEVYDPKLPIQLLYDWRRAPVGGMTFATCCIFKERERWHVLEVPGAGDDLSENEIKALLHDDERAAYEECIAARVDLLKG